MTNTTQTIMALADAYASEVAAFANSFTRRKRADSMSPLAVNVEEVRAVLERAIEAAHGIGSEA